nr:protein phosphatase 2C 70 [Tanacetum cinerariifolium]
MPVMFVYVEKGKIYHRIRILHLILTVNLMERRLTKTLLLMLLMKIIMMITVIIVVLFSATLVLVHPVRLLLYQRCVHAMDEVVVCGDVAMKGHVNVVKDGLFSCNSKCGCGNYVCKETCHPGVYVDCELLQEVQEASLTWRVLPSDLLVVDSEVSGKHPVINWNLNKLKWELVDLGSLNRTLLNYKAVHHPQIGSRHRGDAVELTSGNTITLGTTSKLSESLFAKELVKIIPLDFL